MAGELATIWAQMQAGTLYQTTIAAATWSKILTQAKAKGYPMPLEIAPNEFNVHYEGYFIKVFVV